MKKIILIVIVLSFPILLSQDVPKKAPQQAPVKQEQLQQQQLKKQQDLNQVYKSQNAKLDSILKAKKDTIK